MEYLLLVPSLALAVLLWLQGQSQAAERNAKDQALLDLLGQFTTERSAWSLERAKLLVANEDERKGWQRERTELLNRIQAPEVSAWVNPHADAPMPQAVGFDNDEEFKAAKQIMAQMESSS